MIKRRAAELAIATKAQLAESPVWDSRTGLLVWADIACGIVWRSDVSTGHSEMHAVHDRVGCINPFGDSGYILAGGNTISVMDYFGEETVVLASTSRDRHVKLNDGAVDAAGRFWVGSACIRGDAGTGALYCLDADGELHQVLSSLFISNGMDWSPDGSVFYHVDTASGGIDAYDAQLDAPVLSRRSRLVDIPPELGLADGLTVDVDGCLWLAIWFAGEVRRYSPSGELMEILSVPASLTSSCTFGGHDLRTLYITTAQGLSRGDRDIGTHAGSIFAIETQTAGQSRPPYRLSTDAMHFRDLL